MINPTTQSEERATALVLSGGGAKGAFQVGALQVLQEAGYTYNAISGVSAGSLNGVMIATGQFEELVEVWEGLTEEQVLRKQSLITLARRFLTYKLGLGDPPVSLYRNEPLKELMKQYLLGKAVTVPFHFGFVQLQSGVYVQATIRRSGDHTIDKADLERVLASTAIPVFFNPASVGDSLSVDGGLRNISPIRQVLPYRTDRVVIIPTEPVGADPEEANVRDIIEIACRSIMIMLDEIFEEDIDRFLVINRLVKQAEAKGVTLTKSNGSAYSYLRPVVIDPPEPLGDALDFDNRRIRNLMTLGRQRAREVLEEMGGEQ